MKEVLVKIVSKQGCETRFGSGIHALAKETSVFELTQNDHARVRALMLNERSIWYCWRLFHAPDLTLYIIV